MNDNHFTMSSKYREKREALRRQRNAKARRERIMAWIGLAALMAAMLTLLLGVWTPKAKAQNLAEAPATPAIVLLAPVDPRTTPLTVGSSATDPRKEAPWLLLSAGAFPEPLLSLRRTKPSRAVRFAYGLLPEAMHRVDGCGHPPAVFFEETAGSVRGWLETAYAADQGLLEDIASARRLGFETAIPELTKRLSDLRRLAAANVRLLNRLTVMASDYQQSVEQATEGDCLPPLAKWPRRDSTNALSVLVTSYEPLVLDALAWNTRLLFASANPPALPTDGSLSLAERCAPYWFLQAVHQWLPAELSAAANKADHRLEFFAASAAWTSEGLKRVRERARAFSCEDTSGQQVAAMQSANVTFRAARATAQALLEAAHPND